MLLTSNDFDKNRARFLALEPPFRPRKRRSHASPISALDQMEQSLLVEIPLDPFRLGHRRVKGARQAQGSKGQPTRSLQGS